MVQKIRQNGGDVWYLLAKDEGHGFRKKNRDYMINAIVMFFEKYLLAKKPEGQEIKGKVKIGLKFV